MKYNMKLHHKIDELINEVYDDYDNQDHGYGDPEYMELADIPEIVYERAEQRLIDRDKEWLTIFTRWYDDNDCDVETVLTDTLGFLSAQPDITDYAIVNRPTDDCIYICFLGKKQKDNNETMGQ